LTDDTNARSTMEGSIDVQVTVEEPAPLHERDAHEPPNLSRLEDTAAVPRFDAGADAT
jgi:hypothetical protein